MERYPTLPAVHRFQKLKYGTGLLCCRSAIIQSHECNRSRDRGHQRVAVLFKKFNTLREKKLNKRPTY